MSRQKDHDLFRGVSVLAEPPSFPPAVVAGPPVSLPATR